MSGRTSLLPAWELRLTEAARFRIVVTLRAPADHAKPALSEPQPRVAVYVTASKVRLLLRLFRFGSIFVVPIHA
jgi:hypothetical protein